MTRTGFSRLRLPLAIALASAAHVAAFAMVPHLVGQSDGAGEDGTALVSLQAASGQIAALVEEWDRPPTLAGVAQPDMPDLAPPPDLPHLAPSEAAPALALAAPIAPPPGVDRAPEAAAAPSPAPAVEIGAIAGLALPAHGQISAPDAPAAASESAPEAPRVAPPLAPVATVDATAPQQAAPPAPPETARPKTRPKAVAEPKAPRKDTAKTAPAKAPTSESKTKPKTQDSGATSTGQKALGSGQGTVAGQGGQAKGTTLSKARINDLKSGWGAEIRARIEARKRYPAQANGASGKVTLRLTITREGRLSAVSVAKSSGSGVLDAAAVRAVKAAGRFARAPKGLGEANYSFTLPMSFAR